MANAIVEPAMRPINKYNTRPSASPSLSTHLPSPRADQQQREEVARRFVTRALWPPGATLEPTPPPGVVVALLVAPPVVVFVAVAVAVAAVPRVGERCRLRLLF